MKRLFLFSIFFISALVARGQVINPSGNTTIVNFPGAPTGACTNLMIATRTDTGAFYDCFGGVWTAVSTGSSPGTVTSVSGTSNQIDVATGTTTPALSLDPALIFPGTANGKFIGGVSNSSSYAGSTLDAQINSAAADAVALSNGNTSGLVDSSGSGGTQTIAAQTTIGNGTNLMAWKTPPYCNWNATGFTGGTTSVILQNTETKIYSPGGRGSCVVNGNSTTDGIYALYQVGGTYIQEDGLNFFNRGTATASGAAVLWGGTADNSYFNNSVVLNYVAGQTAFRLGGTTASPFSSCCSTIFMGDTLYNNNTGGIVFDIEGSNANGTPRDWVAIGGSSGHSAPSTAVILCNDTSTNHLTSLNLFGYYVETNNTDAATPPIQNTGCGRTAIRSLGIEKTTGGQFTGPAITFDSTANTIADISDIQLYNWSTSAPVVQNNSTDFCSAVPCNVMSNAVTRLARYTKGRSWADDSTLFASQDTVIANASSTGTTLNKLAKLTGAPLTAVLPATTDTNELVYIVTSGAGTTGSATLAISGQAQCVFSNATTAKDYVGVSTTTAGDCLDLGVAPPSAPPSGTRAIGTVETTNGSAGTYWVLLSSAGSSPFNQTVQNNGTPVTQEPAINLIPGTDITLGFTDTPGVSTNITVTASGSVANAWSAITSAANTQTGAFSTTAPWTFSAAGAASTPGMTISGAPFAGTGTTSVPQLYMFCSGSTPPTSWVTTTTYFGGNSCTGFTGNWIDFHANGGLSGWSLSAGGTVVASGSYTLGSGQGLHWSARSELFSGANGVISASNATGGSNNFQSAAFQSIGTTFTASGCSNSTLAGGSTAGKYTSGTSGTCTVTVTFGGSMTGTNGNSCSVWDLTTPADLQEQTAMSTTTATFSGTTVSGDIITFACTLY